MERLSAPARTREELRALMNGDLGTAAGRGDLVHLAVRLIVEEALEGEVSDVLGRGRYERGEGEKAGYRNGYRPGKMKTAEGAVDYSAPQVRDTPEPFVSSVRAALSGRTRELERLAVELYARGLSTRDIEDTFTDETGRRLLSRAAVSEITEKLWAEYEDFCKRDLSEPGAAKQRLLSGPFRMSAMFQGTRPPARHEGLPRAECRRFHISRIEQEQVVRRILLSDVRNDGAARFRSELIE